jgi:hypothetical protein
MAWIQYEKATGFAPATRDEPVEVLPDGLAQIECPPELGDAAQYDIDINTMTFIPKGSL